MTGGRIGDQIGRRRAFGIGLALFTLASAACGLAPDTTQLILARLAQGLAAALGGVDSDLAAGAGMGLCITPIVATVLANVEPHLAGTVSGLLSTMTQLRNAVGVAIVGVIFFGLLGAGFTRRILANHRVAIRRA